jgi:hypothetical protein
MSNQHDRIPVPFIVQNINAIELLGRFSNAARESGWTAAQLKETMVEAMSGDNKNLHRVLARYCVAPQSLTPSERTKLKKSMKNTITLSLSPETDGVVLGNLFRGGESLLSMAHPTSIVAAIFAMGESKVIFQSDTMESVQFSFPVSVADLLAILRLVNNMEGTYFMARFAESSWLKFPKSATKLV